MTKKLLYSGVVVVISLVIAISAFAQTMDQDGSTDDMSTKESFVIGPNDPSGDVPASDSPDDPSTGGSSDDPPEDSSATDSSGDSSEDLSGGSSEDPAIDPSTPPSSWDSIFASVPLDPGICGPVLNPAVREDFRRIAPILVDRCEIISPTTPPGGQDTDPTGQSEVPNDPTQVTPAPYTGPDEPSTVPGDQETSPGTPGTFPYGESTTPTP